MTKNNKRIFMGLMICVLVSLFSIAVYAEGESAFLSAQYEVDLGENIEIELKATDSIGIIAMLCEVEFDSEYLEILRYDDAKLIGGMFTAKTDESPMRLFWMDALASKNTLVEGTLGKFTFKAMKSGKTKINVIYKEAFSKSGTLVTFENAVIEVDVKGSDISVPETKEYTIKATAGENGIIAPSGDVKVMEGKQMMFSFTPASGYQVADVKVDGKSKGAILEYTYESVNGDSSIEVSFKKISSAVVVTPITPSAGTSSEKTEEEWGNPFSDVKTDAWYYEYVKYINTKKLMNGISADKFGPNDTVTRAMFVTVLYRLEKEPNATKASFTDVAEGTYYEKAVGWAVQNGIVNGVSKTEFAPNTTITREQMATIIYRYIKFKGLDIPISASTEVTTYKDFADVSEYAKDAMRYVCSKGIIGGTSETTLAPKESATRAQMAAIFQRCEKLLLNQ